MGRWLASLGVATILAACLGACGSSSPAAVASPTPDVAKLYRAAADKSNASSDSAQRDFTAAQTQYQSHQLSDAALLARAQADFKKIASVDDSFIADVLKIPFPDKHHQDVNDLVKAVSAHRDACAALSAASSLFGMSAAVSKVNDANTQVGAAVDIIRADLGLPRASP